MKIRAYQWSIGLCLLAFLLSISSLWAAQDAVSDYPFRVYSPSELQAFTKQLQGEHDQLLADLKKKYADNPDKIKKNVDLWAYEQVLAIGKDLATQAKQTPADPKISRTFNRMQRMHFAILADLGVAGPSGSKLKGGITMGLNMFGGPLRLNVPDVIIPSQPLGERAAAKEANRVYSQKSAVAVTHEEMAKMSALEVSRLQPADDHVAIRPEDPSNYYDTFLKSVVAAVQAVDKKYAQFDLNYARHILTFDELKEDATSPKITAKDRYGIKWKVKWGDEVHTDVAATRLYIDLGGIYTDLKFYSGPGELILVLAPPKSTEPGTPKTFKEMADQLLKSKFEFHADRYLLTEPVLRDKEGNILGTGLVTKEMADQESLDAKYVGSYFVKFKECQLSLYNPAIKRLGGASLSNLRAPQDRVARSSMVFNAWIKNKDMKDDNARAGFIFNPKSGTFDQYVEFQSDLGCTFGALRPSGELNSFEEHVIMMMPQTINFFMRPLYIPDCWKDCTWADARWMALRIAKLSRADMERSFTECGWPPFAQKVAVEKLISRRNDLVKAFHLEEDGISEMPCDVKFTFEAKGKNGPDFPVKNGKINEDSTIVQGLEESVHPEGLAKVISRKND